MISMVVTARMGSLRVRRNSNSKSFRSACPKHALKTFARIPRLTCCGSLKHYSGAGMDHDQDRRHSCGPFLPENQAQGWRGHRMRACLACSRRRNTAQSSLLHGARSCTCRDTFHAACMECFGLHHASSYQAEHTFSCPHHYHSSSEH